MRGEMMKKTREIPFSPADILLPKKGIDLEKWSVIACDQFTSRPDYWDEADRTAGDEPSALRITLPEVYLGGDDTAERINKINSEMEKYVSEGILEEYRDTIVYVERTLPDGTVRHGIVGKINLSAYDFTKGTKPLIRPTEGTVLERIPPRVKIREGASLELPHVMLLIDDPMKTVIEPLADAGKTPLYDTPLMIGGGHIRGYALSESAKTAVLSALAELVDDDDPFLFAVGDGNHSLATAKTCVKDDEPLSRYALVEAVNIHDESLVFEPIYRTVFGADPDELIAEAEKIFTGGSSPVEIVSGGKSKTLYTEGFCVGRLQAMLDSYIGAHPGVTVDYIHGEDEARSLSEKENTVSFIFNGIDKSELFPFVSRYGVLPRKSFSMGEAKSKRYYMEARKIR